MNRPKPAAEKRTAIQIFLNPRELEALDRLRGKLGSTSRSSAIREAALSFAARLEGEAAEVAP
jgi:metal-responsive CopG/Arc/MetJ family transcriptional regulator